MGAIRTFPQIGEDAKVYAPKTLMQTLFTQEEQLAFAGHPQGMLFIAFLAATPFVDINNEEFKADIVLSVDAGLISQERADQVLAGINPASKS